MRSRKARHFVIAFLPFYGIVNSLNRDRTCFFLTSAIVAIRYLDRAFWQILLFIVISDKVTIGLFADKGSP